MKKTILLFVVTTALFLSVTVQAQKQGKKISVGLGVESGLVAGHPDFKKTFSSEYGLTGRLYVLTSLGYITFTTGGALVMPRSMGRNNVKLGEHIPFKLGYKYNVGKKFFIMSELGYSIYNMYSATHHAGSEAKKTTLNGMTFAPAVGFNLRKLEISLKYEITRPARGEDKSIQLLGVRAGFNF